MEHIPNTVFRNLGGALYIRHRSHLASYRASLEHGDGKEEMKKEAKLNVKVQEEEDRENMHRFNNQKSYGVNPLNIRCPLFSDFEYLCILLFFLCKILNISQQWLFISFLRL